MLLLCRVASLSVLIVFVDTSHSNMGVATPALLGLCCALCAARAVDVGPVFPDGVAEIVADMHARMKSASAEHVDDADAVANLKQDGLVAIAGDLLYDSLSQQLKTAAFAMIQARLLKFEYAGGCPREMVGCPTFWADQGDGLCAPPDDYDGLCAATDVKGLSVEEKEVFAWKCKASWPCAPSCKLVFGTCPDTWQNIDGLCLAPLSYDGTCSPAMRFTSFTPQQKAEWAAMCSARWPCA